MRGVTIKSRKNKLTIQHDIDGGFLSLDADSDITRDRMYTVCVSGAECTKTKLS